METLYFTGFVATIILALFARRERNYAEMRTLLITAFLFISLFMERFYTL